jgi:hypothetical protein
MKKRWFPWLLVALLGITAPALVPGGVSALAGPASFTQVISPADGTPVVASTRLAPTGLAAALLAQTIDWSALGFTTDPTLDFDNTALADLGPASTSLADPPSNGGTLVVGNLVTCPNA